MADLGSPDECMTKIGDKIIEDLGDCGKPVGTESDYSTYVTPNSSNKKDKSVLCEDLSNNNEVEGKSKVISIKGGEL